MLMLISKSKMSKKKVFLDDASKSIITFLQANVPKSEIPNIESALKNEFILAKKKSKQVQQKTKKIKAHILTRKEKRKLGFYSIPRNSLNYSDIIPMNKLWNEYINEILELDKPIPDSTSKNWEHFTQSLYKADFHGSMLSVVRSKCPSYVGKTGICIMDTKNTFKIVSRESNVFTIPKKECVFALFLKNMKVTLFGKHLCVRPAERSTKKIKGRLHPDL